MDSNGTTSNSKSKKTSFPILQVIQQYLKTTKKGANYWAVCPFHKDTSPSLSVSEEKNMFKCFACGVAGDALSFVLKIESCGYVEAIKKITTLLNLDPSDYLSERDNGLYRLYKLNSLVAEAYHKCLFNKANKEHLDYLTQTRSISLENIKKYKLGFAPQKDILIPFLSTYLKNNPHSWTNEDLDLSCLFNPLKTGEKEPYFKEKIMFPIFNSDKQVVGFSSRSIREGQPKYVNLKTTPAFSKKNAIFNIQFLKPEEPIYIFEGFIDLINCSQSGFPNGIACMGGTLDTQVFETLASYSKEIFLCLDNDEAGLNFTQNLAKSLISQGFKVKVVDLFHTQAKDIDELLKSNPEIASDALLNPINFFSWNYKRESKKLDLTDLSSLQLFVNSSLDLLFNQDPKGHASLKSGVDISFAKTSLKLIFEFYKNLKEYSESTFEPLIKQKLSYYSSKIVQSVFIPAQPTIEDLQITSHTPYSDINNPFTKLAIKYQTLLTYSVSNLDSLFKEPGWLYSLPLSDQTTYPEEFEDLFTQIQSLDPEKPLVLEESQKHLDFLSKYKEYSVCIKDTGDFLNSYYSFLSEYINLLILTIKQIPTQDYTMRWIKIVSLQDQVISIHKKSSDFFKNSSFSKRDT